MTGSQLPVRRRSIHSKANSSIWAVFAFTCIASEQANPLFYWMQGLLTLWSSGRWYSLRSQSSLKFVLTIALAWAIAIQVPILKRVATLLKNSMKLWFAPVSRLHIYPLDIPLRDCTRLCLHLDFETGLSDSCWKTPSIPTN